MKRKIFLSISLLMLAKVVHAATPTFTTLRPGQFREINQDLTINVVFVGYEQGVGPRDINEAVFRAGLPERFEQTSKQ